MTRAGEPQAEPGVFGSLEPEPLEKKQEPEPLEKTHQEPEPEPLGKKFSSRSRKKLAGSSALPENKKHKEIVL